MPLDANYPRARLECLIEEAGLELVLTDEGVGEQLPAGRAEPVNLESERVAIGAESDDDLEEKPRAENLAYLIFTSGSTGKPKGVMIEHRSVAAFLNWTQEVFSQEEMNGVLASSSICFDLSVFEIFAPLCMKGRVILVENALQLPEVAAKDQVRLINTVPSAIAECIRADVIPFGVTTVNLAGEALSNTLAQKIYEQKAVKRVLNLYGPSEDTTYSTYACIERKHNGNIMIGRPITNTQVYILDEERNLQAIGIAGELYISGEGLARGYYGRPDLTAERFAPNPHRGSGERMYRTGDLCRCEESGDIQYLGRLDHQMKLRGYRIELGEIEAALEEQAGVREAVVEAVGEGGDKSLVGYVVSEEEISEAKIRKNLKERLPEYMVPAAIVRLEELPLTANGKLDRRRLPKPEWDRPRKEGRTRPSNEVEELVAAVWVDVLGLQEVGVDENFFDLGGHSLKATGLQSRLRKIFRVNIELRGLFESPTVAQQARLLVDLESTPGNVEKIAQLFSEILVAEEHEAESTL